MKDTVEWLISIEGRAERIFERLAESFRDDAILSGFLKKLSEDESLHRRTMENILSTVKGDIAPFLGVKNGVRVEVEDVFSACEKAVEDGTVTRENLFDHVMDVEAAELNRVCLHVVNTLKHCHRGFIADAARINQHKASVDRFIRHNPEFERYAGRLEALPEVWRERILVVEDDEFAAEALKATVESEGRVDTAKNGREALRMIGASYYAAILADVEMPVMGGIELKDRAEQVFPGIERRMLFLTEASNLRSQDILRKKNLRFITKPDGAVCIRKAVAGILCSL